MNESDLLMMSLPPVLPPIGCYHNSSQLNYIDTGDSVYDLASVSRTSTAHALPAEGKVSKSVRIDLTYKKFLFLKYLVKFLSVYLTN